MLGDAVHTTSEPCVYVPLIEYGTWLEVQALYLNLPSVLTLSSQECGCARITRQTLGLKTMHERTASPSESIAPTILAMRVPYSSRPGPQLRTDDAQKDSTLRICPVCYVADVTLYP